MTKDVIIEVESFQKLHDQEDQSMSTKSQGKFYEKDGEYIILYEEKMEENDMSVKNRLRISAENVTLRKSGPVTWEMMFQEGIRNEADYHTGYGPLSMAVETDSILMVETDNQIRLKICYQLEVQGQHHAACEIRMIIKSK